jgi:hypothetical protein
MVVAVVGAADGVRLVALGSTREEVLERVAEYVKARVEFEHAATDARRIRQLLAAGAIDAALEAYFESGDRRWDEEWLHVATPPIANRASAPLRAAR